MAVVDIEQIKDEIVERLLPLHPDKILLFGSYAYGNPTQESDIDLFLVKDIQKEEIRRFAAQARLKLYDIIKKYHIGFDILVANQSFLENRDDYFYKQEIEKKAKVLYE